MVDLGARLRDLLPTGALDLPRPGRGQTPERHRALFEFGRQDLSLARLVEAHADAVAILTEAGRDQDGWGRTYGVWASEGPGPRLELVERSGRLRLHGEKRFCTGSGILDAALVTAHRGGSIWLVDVELTAPGVSVAASPWRAFAFSETETSTVRFDDVALDEGQLIGGPNWYAERVGFWHGAIGPAACWAGGAAGLVDAAWRTGRSNPHARAQLGALTAAAWGLRALLDQAGQEIDADPQGGASSPKARALMVRHLIERACTDVLDRFGRATGPRLLAFDELVARRHAEVALYIRQCHAERDLETLAETAGP